MSAVEQLNKAIKFLDYVEKCAPEANHTNSPEFNAALYYLKMGLETLGELRKEEWVSDSPDIKKLFNNAAYLRNRLTHGYFVINNPDNSGLEILKNFVCNEIPAFRGILALLIESAQSSSVLSIPPHYNINSLQDSALYQAIGSYGTQNSSENKSILPERRFAHILHHAKLFAAIDYSNLDGNRASLFKMAGLNQLSIIGEAVKHIPAEKFPLYFGVDGKISAIRYIEMRNELAHLKGNATSMDKIKILQNEMHLLIERIEQGLSSQQAAFIPSSVSTTATPSSIPTTFTQSVMPEEETKVEDPLESIKKLIRKQKNEMREMREKRHRGDGDSTITFLNADEETKNTQERAAPAHQEGRYLPAFQAFELKNDSEESYSYESRPSSSSIVDKLKKSTPTDYSHSKILQAISDSCDDAESLANVVWKMIKKENGISRDESQNFDSGFRTLLTNKINEMDIVGKSKEKIASQLQESWNSLVKNIAVGESDQKPSIK
jgi:uncharacterized protein with HEPN domain